jgi:hypothetical protein
MLHHDNDRFYTVRATQERIQELQWEHLEYPPYSPNLDSIDFHLFGQLKTTLVANVSLMKRLKRKWLRQQPRDIYAAGFDALIKQWDRCISASGGYVEK